MSVACGNKGAKDKGHQHTLHSPQVPPMVMPALFKLFVPTTINPGAESSNQCSVALCAPQTEELPWGSCFSSGVPHSKQQLP